MANLLSATLIIIALTIYLLYIHPFNVLSAEFIRILTNPSQAFRFTVGPGHCPIISKYGLSLSKAVGPVDPSFLVVKISHLNKNK